MCHEQIFYSLHLRLGIVLILMLAVIWLSLWFGSRSVAANSSARDIDHQLSTTALSLTKVMLQVKRSGGAGHERKPNRAEHNASTSQPERSLYYEILGTHADVISQSPGFPAQLGNLPAGFTDRQSAGQSWRIFTLIDRPNGLVVRVASTETAQRQRAEELSARFSAPLLMGIPLLVILAALVIWQGLAPLRKIERALARQSPLDLEPLAINRKRMPTELRGLVETLDSMMGRIRGFVARQRAFAAAAAHELRTPLAACATQAELAQRSPEADKRHRALERVRQTVDRMARLVSQLLLLARATHSVAAKNDAPIDLNAAVENALESCRSKADQAKITLVFDQCETKVEVPGNAELLECLIGNLISNAIDVSPAGSEIRLATESGKFGAVITVHDQGPGLDLQYSERLFEPFYSKETAEDGSSGSGLGLSIVKAVVEYHRGRIDLRNDPVQGAAVHVELPYEG